jgi:hypothetical protein
MLCRLVNTGVSRRLCGFIFRVKQFDKSAVLHLTLKVKSLRYFEGPVTMSQSIWRNNTWKCEYFAVKAILNMSRVVGVTNSESPQCDVKMTSGTGNYHRDWRIETESCYSQYPVTRGWSFAEFNHSVRILWKSIHWDVVTWISWLLVVAVVRFLWLRRHVFTVVLWTG